MERSLEPGGGWVLVPRPMRVAAILLGLWGAQTLMYGYWYGFTLLPSRFLGQLVWDQWLGLV